MTQRDVGYVRRNELGRTIDRGFSSKPRKLRVQGDTDEDWAQGPDTARGMRDPFNRPVNAPTSWNGGGRFDMDSDKDWRWNCECSIAYILNIG